jgi:hypothetical protein
VAAAREPNLDKTKIRPMTVPLTASYDSGTTSGSFARGCNLVGWQKARSQAEEFKLPRL